MGEGPESSHGAMSAREEYGCDVEGRVPGETAGSSSLRKQMLALVMVCGMPRFACAEPRATKASAAKRPVSSHGCAPSSGPARRSDGAAHCAATHQKDNSSAQTYLDLSPDFNFPTAVPFASLPGPLTVSVDL